MKKKVKFYYEGWWRVLSSYILLIRELILDKKNAMNGEDKI